MANSTTAIVHNPVTPEQQQQAALQRLEAAVAGREATLVALLDFAEALQKSRLLEMATALLNQGEQVLEILVAQANKPGGAGALKNLLALVNSFSQIDSDALAKSLTLVAKASQQMDFEHGPQVNGVWSMVKAARDPDVKHGLQAALTLLMALGRASTDTSN